MTHNDLKRIGNEARAPLTNNAVRIGRSTPMTARLSGLGLGVALVAALPACGSQVSGGNTGSETHWLQSCDSDADCGVYSCLCGVCSRSCDDNDECDGASGIESRCESTSQLSCSGETPVRICVNDANSSQESPDAAPPNTVTPDAAPSATATSDSVMTEPVTPSNGSQICDGSDDIRWVFYTEPPGLLGGTESFFLTYYGYQSLAIDGNCNFWGSTFGKMVSGKLTNSQVLEAYQSAQYGRLDRFGEAPLPQPDAPISIIWDPSGTIHGNTGSQSPGSDPEYFEALVQAQQLTDEVIALGEPSRGPLRAIFLPLREGASDVASWPLELDPTQVIRESNDWSTGYFKADTGVLFEAGSRANTLRTALDSSRAHFRYSGTESVDFIVAARDEPPTRVAAFVHSVVRSTYTNTDSTGMACDDDARCDAWWLTCQENHDSETQCRACIGTQDSEWLCDSNDDCCGGAVCCLDCGENSGKCITEPDPCPYCLANDGAWVDYRTCDTSSCVPDTTCFTNECPGQCAEDNCGGCGRSDDCWAAGCQWNLVAESASCGRKPEVVEPPDVPCSVDATNDDLPGVSVHLEADACTFLPGEGGQFRYTVTFDQSVEFTSESSGGACGLCGVTTDPETWTTFVIDGGDAKYCPECDVGCCAPTEEAPVTFDAQSTQGTVDWPGLEWSGPSDTGNEPTEPFAPGSYEAKVTLRLPGLGEVIALLPIEVVAAP